jgi:ketosteroid isomerase-like protein
MVRQAFDFWNRADFESLATTQAPETEWDLSRFEGWPEQSVYRGVEGLRRLWDTFLGEWSDWRVEPLRIVDVGDRVFAHGRQVGRGRRSGAPVSVEYGQITTFNDDGRVVRNEIYSHLGEALEAAGLNE